MHQGSGREKCKHTQNAQNSNEQNMQNKLSTRTNLMNLKNASETYLISMINSLENDVEEEK